MAFDVLAELLLLILFIVALGFLLKKRGVIDSAFQTKLSDLLLRAVLPLSVLATGNYTYSPDMGGKLALSAVISCGYYVLALPLVWLFAKRIKMPAGRKGLFTTLCVFANTAFLGFPLVNALYGAEGMLYAVIYNLAYQIFLFTAGVMLLGGKARFSWREILLDPLTLCSVASIVLFISPLQLPPVLFSAMETVGDMSVPISMMVIGCNLADIHFRDLWRNRYSYIVSLLRLVVFPLAMAGVLYTAGLRGVLPAACVLITALPAGSLNVILAEKYELDAKFAASSVLQNMVLMLLGVPLVLWATTALF